MMVMIYHHDYDPLIHHHNAITITIHRHDSQCGCSSDPGSANNKTQGPRGEIKSVICIDETLM